MRSFLGTLTSLQEAAIYYYTKDYNAAKKIANEAKSIYKGLKIEILNLSEIEDKLKASDIDPDIASEKEGYVILIKVPEDMLNHGN
ncbi:hypothetical protein [Saccharolobus caldissimus]|uniref:Uncharacterized protein n=1 Tax=Saccharolobus caldissimus TaxID=1702097 RepID=A0AAQ4CML2_9CREN|nr:hypothetical protein [Saccharolobus caldissimus]BDB97043.1 hypothetical protein SACC_00600 [Saccharolobus caldissimus]